MKMTGLDLFSGAGGMSLGFERAGIEPIQRAEIDGPCSATLAAAVKAGWLGDATNVGLVDASREWPHADVVYGGPPCQAFSNAGRRGGEADPRGVLVYEFARVVAQTQPRYFVMENVAALQQRNMEGIHSAFLALTEQAGYTVRWGVLKADDYGTAQRRTRAIYIGALDGSRIWPDEGGLHRTLRDALEGIEPGPGASYSALQREVFSAVPPGGNWRSLPEPLGRRAMGSAYDRNDGGRTSYWRRLSWDAPSTTLVTSLTQRATGFCHPDELHPLTVNEAAALQDFPVGYPFQGTMADQYRQIGNAMPVRLAEAVARAVVAAANG